MTWYQYMRLAGYPAEKISILTTYNGQKALLKDVIENRCAGHPAFGRPHKVRDNLLTAAISTGLSASMQKDPDLLAAVTAGEAIQSFPHIAYSREESST